MLLPPYVSVFFRVHLHQGQDQFRCCCDEELISILLKERVKLIHAILDFDAQ